MAFTVKDWKQLPAELEPTAGETVADWRARIAAYAAANPTLVTPVNAAALEDVETRLSGYTDSQVSAEATARGTAVSAEATARASADTTLTTAVAAKADAAATTTALAAKQATSEKGQPNGYASLDGTGKVPSAQLPAAQSGSGLPANVLIKTANFTAAAGRPPPLRRDRWRVYDHVARRASNGGVRHGQKDRRLRERSQRQLLGRRID
jgi:hypothetical protein